MLKNVAWQESNHLYFITFKKSLIHHEGSMVKWLALWTSIMEVMSSNPIQATSFLFFSTKKITFVLFNIFEWIWYSEFILVNCVDIWVYSIKSYIKALFKLPYSQTKIFGSKAYLLNQGCTVKAVSKMMELVLLSKGYRKSHSNTLCSCGLFHNLSDLWGQILVLQNIKESFRFAKHKKVNILRMIS